MIVYVHLYKIFRILDFVAALQYIKLFIAVVVVVVVGVAFVVVVVVVAFV